MGIDESDSSNGSDANEANGKEIMELILLVINGEIDMESVQVVLDLVHRLILQVNMKCCGFGV
ncbi:hypothetical protein C5167_050537 [Papaver somniferum]|uniref:Uncharacterized protein n=1 Tax=Papaver somniferum TaxID=3469 RepID=A0A4Y7LGV7_PAPSO|nr:hypothetical protein C5167_050537 [Papaver somniferum]